MATTKRDYYEVLSVSRNADGEEIKRSYRKLAMQYHPDRNEGDSKAEAELRFKECAEAYEVLSDPAKRQRYDQHGHAGVNGQQHDFSHMDVGDIFEMFGFGDIFGGRGGRGGRGQGGRGGPQPGQDLETQVELTLSEIADGCDKSIEFTRNESCETCKGTGAKAGSSPVQCGTCRGQGQVMQQGFGGMFRMVTTCPACKGRGSVIKDKCRDCGGEGKRQKKRQVNLKIPAGINEGQGLRLTGEGEAGDPGAPAGDLHCYVTIRPHPIFTRHHNDLVCQVPISFALATLGGKIDVPTLKGSEEIEVSAGAQHGDFIKLPGKGIADLRTGQRGAQIVQVLVEIPRKLTEKQRTLLMEYAKTEDVHAMPQRKGFLDKIKQAVTGEARK
jgi:molecular chaperone DnaJ